MNDYCLTSTQQFFVYIMARTSGQTKDYKIGMFCLSAKHKALTRMNKDWLSRNEDNVSELERNV
jgi:hypothetical protein